jgi:hypothetical protein
MKNGRLLNGHRVNASSDLSCTRNIMSWSGGILNRRLPDLLPVLQTLSLWLAV